MGKWGEYQKVKDCLDKSESIEQLESSIRYALLWYEKWEDYSTYSTLYNAHYIPTYKKLSKELFIHEEEN